MEFLRIMKKIILLGTLFVSTLNVISQSDGDFRTINSGNWNDHTRWERYDGINGVWVSATAGQFPGVVPGASVWIRNGHNITLNITPTNSIADLTVGQGTSGSLTTDATVRTLTVTGNLTINSGATFNLASCNLTVNGNTTISGTLSDNNNNGSQTFNGNFTVNTGGSVTTNNTSPFVFGGNITNNGTFNKIGTGAITIANAGTKTISGSEPITWAGNITINSNVELINNLNANLELRGSLNGQSATSKFTQGSNAVTLYAGASAPMSTGELDAAASGNTFTYNGNNDQTIRDGVYYHLIISGTVTALRNKNLTGSTTIIYFL